MPRLNRNSPLPSAAQPRVDNSTTQRAFDLLFTPLKAVVEFLQPYVQPEKWKLLSYGAGWSDIGGLGSFYTRGSYRKDPMGRVWVRGLAVRSGATTTIATLPEGYRPPRACIYSLTVGGGGTARVDVEPTGNIIYVAGGNPNSYLSLDGLSFDTVNE